MLRIVKPLGVPSAHLRFRSDAAWGSELSHNDRALSYGGVMTGRISRIPDREKPPEVFQLACDTPGGGLLHVAWSSITCQMPSPRSGSTLSYEVPGHRFST